jgi:ribonuclease PH
MVLCTASVTAGVPKHRETVGGWLTAEYCMLPGSTPHRTDRESAKGRIQGRTHEIQRLIGRSLRAIIDLPKLGLNTIHLDCEVMQADGGTRTASITGAWVALALAVDKLLRDGRIESSPLTGSVAAVSCGIYGGRPLLDLDYIEDSRAEVDMNLVMTSSGDMVEVQATGEGGLLKRSELDALIDLVGELVIAAATSDAASQRADVLATKEAQATVTQLVSTIRDTALSLRMVPIGETFARFHRVVRDVSAVPPSARARARSGA